MSRDKFYGKNSPVAGDLVKINQSAGTDGDVGYWTGAEGRLGVVIAEAMRVHIPAAKVMVLGEVVEFDLDELEKVNASR